MLTNDVNAEKGSLSLKRKAVEITTPLCVAALYHFARISNPNELQAKLIILCKQESTRGTLIIAPEGINGTIAGTELSIANVINFLKSLEEFKDLEVKYSTSTGSGFHHMRIKLKSEIVTMGKPDIDPVLSAGTYVNAKDWNALISRSDVVLVDTRNSYEIHIGKFKGAIDPCTETFRDFPEWADKFVASTSSSSAVDSSQTVTAATSPVSTVEQPAATSSIPEAAGATAAPKIVAMYCTGGIRCEKATVYMKQLGVQEVYHLQGGILKYLEEVPEASSLWEGECFVFDERVSLKHGLLPGSYSRCYACKMPLSEEDVNGNHAIDSNGNNISTATPVNASTNESEEPHPESAPEYCPVEKGSPRYEEGVYCTYCVDSQTPAQRQRFRERQLQVVLARLRGEVHVGQKQDSFSAF